MKKNKACKIQVRCTVEEVKEIDKAASKCEMNRSDYVRQMLFHSGKGKSATLENVSVAIAVQELLNYIEKNCPFEDKMLERKVDEIWKIL